jgi:hypothetical protein
MMEIKEYIQSRPAIKATTLAHLVGWNKVSMSLYMNGERGIPEKWEKILKKELEKYGYAQAK